MAFTDVEVRKAREAVIAKAEAADLFRLGLIYSTGHEGRGPDMIEAHKWFNLAALLGSKPAQIYRGELTLEMSADDVTLAQRAARGWLAENRKKVRAKQAA